MKVLWCALHFCLLQDWYFVLSPTAHADKRVVKVKSCNFGRTIRHAQTMNETRVIQKLWSISHVSRRSAQTIRAKLLIKISLCHVGFHLRQANLLPQNKNLQREKKKTHTVLEISRAPRANESGARTTHLIISWRFIESEKWLYASAHQTEWLILICWARFVHKRHPLICDRCVCVLPISIYCRWRARRAANKTHFRR